VSEPSVLGKSALPMNFSPKWNHFKGFLICTTNRLEDLDSAAIRRFAYKIQFDYLTPEGILIFYRKMLEPLIGTPLGNVRKKKIAGIGCLAPGDFNTVRKQCILHSEQDLTHQKTIELLEAEASIKALRDNKRSIGF
jgi:transitional endoplasmic reticulum ATPase